MTDEATQQTAPDHQVPYGEPSFSATDTALAYLVGSAGIACTWSLDPETKPDLVWVVGRGANADFKLPSSSKRLSSTHFQLWATRDDPPTLMIRDCSTNGTFLNSVRLPRDRNFVLVNGDTIAVGLGVPSDEIKLVVSIPKTSRVTPQGGIHEAYDFGEVVGQGAFALVRQAVARETGQKVAVKIIDRAKITGSIQNSVEREIEILKKFRHTNIVALHDIYVTDKHYYLVMDFVPHGDLMDYLLNTQSSSAPGLPEPVARAVVQQVLEAVRYVHDMGVSHRDLKPDNILIDCLDPMRVKVADFGLAKLQAQGTFLKTFCGTLSYLAPEVLASRYPAGTPGGVPGGAQGATAVAQSTPVYTHLVDIWSVGCLAYVILTGCMPFGGSTQDDLFRTVIAGDYHKAPLDSAGVSDEAKAFLHALLDVNTNTRPSAVEALAHPWLTSTVSTVSSLASLPSLGDSQPAAGLRSSIPGMSCLGLQSSQEWPERDDFASQPASRADSEADGDEARREIDARNSQSRASLSQHVGTRDLQEGDEDETPEGAWAALYTLQTSSPCKELFLTRDAFTIGRHAKGPPFTDAPDYAHPDARLSRRHCRILRKPKDNGRYEVFVEAYNTMYVNRTVMPPNTSMPVYDGDRICLFAHEVAPRKFERLVFQLVFFDKQLYDRPPEGKPVLHEIAAPRQQSIAGKRERSRESAPQPKRIHTVYE